MFQNLESFLQRYISVFMSNQSDTIVRNQSDTMLHASPFHILNIAYWRYVLLISQRTHLAKSSQISFFSF